MGPAEVADERERRPEVRRSDDEPAKAFRHDADNLERDSVHQERAVEHAGIAREVSRPGAMAEDNGRTAAELVVRRCERAATRGADAEDVEEVPRHERALHPPAFDPGVDVHRREGIGEDARLASERFILRAREALGLRVGRLLTHDREELVRVPHLVHAKQRSVQQREHDGHQAETEPHRRHNRQGHQGRAAERATGVEDVSDQIVDERRAARVAALVGRDRHGAETGHRARSRLGGAEAVGEVLPGFAFEMERELLIQVALDAARSEQRACPQFQTAKNHGSNATGSKAGMVLRVMVSSIDTNAYGGRLSIVPRCEDSAACSAGRSSPTAPTSPTSP